MVFLLDVFKSAITPAILISQLLTISNKCKTADVAAEIIGSNAVYDINSVSSEEWNTTLGFQVAASGGTVICVSRQMEALIEPWVSFMGVCSSTAGTDGYPSWLEAEKRCQVNVSASVLQVVMKILYHLIYIVRQLGHQKRYKWNQPSSVS